MRRVRWYSLLADGDRLAITALDHFNCAALLTMGPHCAFAISIGICRQTKLRNLRAVGPVPRRPCQSENWIRSLT